MKLVNCFSGEVTHNCFKQLKHVSYLNKSGKRLQCTVAAARTKSHDHISQQKSTEYVAGYQRNNTAKLTRQFIMCKFEDVFVLYNVFVSTNMFMLNWSDCE